MKLNTLAAAIITATATAAAIASACAFADDNARFEAQLAVTSVNNCAFTVTTENGTTMSATYKYTAADQAAGTFGTTTLDTTEPLTVLVSSGGDTCRLGPFTVATATPGEPITRNAAGLRTHDGGFWPLRWMYTQFDAYDDTTAKGGSSQATLIEYSGNLGMLDYTSKTGEAPAGRPTQGWKVIPTNAAEDVYGPYESGQVPAVCTAPDGGHIRFGADYTNYPNSVFMFGGMISAGFTLADPVRAATFTVRPPETARSMRIGLAQIIATFPYGAATKAPDPLTVYDTVHGGGVPVTGTGTMTITPL